jgi:phosphate transport system protein
MNNKISIRKEVMEMWKLVLSQISKSLSALIQSDKDLAREIIIFEERVNSSEILIDTECRNFIASRECKPEDISFIMMVLKINMNLEKIGDIAEDIAYHLVSSQHAIKAELIGAPYIKHLYNEIIQILEVTLASFNHENSSHVESWFEQHSSVEKQDDKLIPGILNYLKDAPDSMDKALRISSIIQNLISLREQSKGIAEEYITYLKTKNEKQLTAALPF